MTHNDPARRRPVQARGSVQIRLVAAWLARQGVPPNVISASSLAFSALAAVAMLLGSAETGVDRIRLLVGAAVLLELRLLANLLDGLVAVEGGRGSPSGEIWNELPDRFSDAITLVSAGYAALGVIDVSVGWAAALAAVMTAYVRALGTSSGASARFDGPMAKQRRMEIIALGCLAAAFEPNWGWHGHALAIAVVVVLVGSTITVARRTAAIVREIESRRI